MIDASTILTNLQTLDTVYSSATDPKLPMFYSKLAVIEFGGWIEESFDEILYNYVDTHLVDINCKTIIRKFIKKNNGFRYDPNTFQTFSIVLGANNWENILDAIPDANRIDFKNTLNKYALDRNSIAHTYSKGITPHYLAPSQVMTDFRKILPAMLKIESEVQAL